MCNLSAGANTGISSQIGALELDGRVEGFGDGSLEVSAAIIQLGMTVSPAACPITQVCRIDDGALEAAGTNMALGPTLGNHGCGAVPRTNYCVQ